MPSTLDPDAPRVLPVAMAFLAGVLAGAVLLTAVPGPAGEPSETSPDPENPPTATYSGGPSCEDGEVNPNAGWVHEVAAGTSYAVTLNATVVHDAGTEVRANVTRRGGNEYELALVTVAVTPGPSLDCGRIRTTFGMGTSLPTAYERFVVTVDGRELVRARRTDTTADLYRLPNPVNATR